MNTWRRNHGRLEHPLESSTCVSPDGNVHRKIDYVTVNQKYRIFVRKTQIAQNWRWNMGHQRQHDVIRAELQLRFKKSYFYKAPIATGKKYITTLNMRKIHELLDQYMREQQIHIQYEPNKTAIGN